MLLKMLRSISAVLAGYLLIDIGIGKLWAIWYPDAKNLPITPSVPFMILSLMFGFLLGVSGGYLCGKIANRSEIKHAAVLGGIVMLSDIIILAMWPIISQRISNEPIWYQWADTLITTGAVLYGGWLCAHQRAKKAGTVQTPRAAQT